MMAEQQKTTSGAEAGASQQAPARKAILQTEIGRISSDKMNKTVTVIVERRVKHPIFGKVVTRTHK